MIRGLLYFAAGALTVLAVVSLVALVLSFLRDNNPMLDVHYVLVSDNSADVTASRTVRTPLWGDADSVVVMTWSASVTVGDVLICSGGGEWPYAPGEYVRTMSLDNWVGDDCLANLVSDEAYELRTAWTWTWYGQKMTDRVVTPFIYLPLQPLQ